MESGELTNGQNTPTSSRASTAYDRSGFVRRKWNSWISLNASWSSKWWYSMVHNITAIVGSGVLSLPAAMAYLGWELGTFALLGFIVLSLVCYWQVVVMHEMVGENGTEVKRFDRYYELGQHLLGKNLGFWIVIPLQTMVEIGVDTVYVITGASSLEKIYELLCHDESCRDIKLSYWMIIFIFIQLFISQLPHIASITWVSCIAALTAIGYSTLAWILIRLQGENPAKPGHDYPEGKSPAYLTFGVFTALGKYAFACAAGHNIAMEIQATIPSTPARPSKVPMWRGAFLAYVVISLCYLPVALIGYGYFGNQKPRACLGPNQNRINGCHLLLVFDRPVWLLVTANIMVVLHMCGSYQIYAMPLFDTLERFIEVKLHWPTTFFIRFCARSLYVLATLFIAASFPFFGDLESFIGGFAIIPTTYLIPSILWHLYKRPRPWGLPWLGNMVCIVFGVLLMLTMTIGGLRNLIIASYRFFV